MSISAYISRHLHVLPMIATCDDYQSPCHVLSVWKFCRAEVVYRSVVARSAYISIEQTLFDYQADNSSIRSRVVESRMHRANSCITKEEE
jgi:hypothetical protein